MHFDKKLRWEKNCSLLHLNLLFIKMSGKCNFCEAWKNMHQISLFAGLHTKVIFFDALWRGWWDRWRDCPETPPQLCVEKAEMSDSAKCVPTKSKRSFRGLYNCFHVISLIFLCVICVRKKVTKIMWYGKRGNRAIVTSSSSMCKIQDYDYCIVKEVKLRLIMVIY